MIRISQLITATTTTSTNKGTKRLQKQNKQLLAPSKTSRTTKGKAATRSSTTGTHTDTKTIGTRTVTRTRT